MSVIIKKYGKTIIYVVALLAAVFLVGFMVAFTGAQSNTETIKTAEELISEASSSLLNNEEQSQAVELLEDVVTTWPDTFEAAQANILLEKMNYNTYLSQDVIQFGAYEEDGRPFFNNNKLGDLDNLPLDDVANRIADDYLDSHEIETAEKLLELVVNHWPESEQASIARVKMIKLAYLSEDYQHVDVLVNEIVSDKVDSHYNQQAIFDAACQMSSKDRKISKATECFDLLVENYPESFHGKISKILKGIYESDLQITKSEMYGKLIDDILKEYSSPEDKIKALKIIDGFCTQQMKEYQFAAQICKTIDRYDPDNIAVDAQRLKYLAADLNTRNQVMSDFEEFKETYVGSDNFQKYCYEIAEYLSHPDVNSMEFSTHISQMLIDEYPGNNYTLWAHLNLARQLIRKGELEHAQEHINAIDQNYANHDKYFDAIGEIAFSCLKNGHFQQSIKLFEDLIGYLPEDHDEFWIMLNLVNSYYEIDKPVSAELLMSSIVKNPEFDAITDSYYFIDVGMMCLENRQYKAANGIFDFAINQFNDLDDCLVQAKTGKAMVAVHLGNDEPGNTLLFELFNEKNEEYAFFTFLIGEAHSYEARYQENSGNDELSKEYLNKAIAIWHKVIKNFPGTTAALEAYQMASSCYQKLGNYQEAINCLQHADANFLEHPFQWNAKLLEGHMYQLMKYSDLLEDAEANRKTAEIYEIVIKNYPTSPASKVARQWLNSNPVLN